MTDTAELSGFKKELIDRFGTLPDEAGNLLLKIMLKILARKAGVARLDFFESSMSLQFSQAHKENSAGIVALISANADRFRLTPAHVLTVRLSHRGVYDRLAQVKNILKDIAHHVNP